MSASYIATKLCRKYSKLTLPVHHRESIGNQSLLSQAVAAYSADNNKNRQNLCSPAAGNCHSRAHAPGYLKLMHNL